MKKEKLWLWLLLCFLILVIPIKTQADEVENNECGIQEAACVAYEELMNSFPVVWSTGEMIYPDNYGGAFITDDGKLIIYTTEEMSLPVALQSSETVVFEACEFSYNELNQIMNILNEFKLSSQDEFKNEFNLYYLSCAENKIVVFLEHLTDENVA